MDLKLRFQRRKAKQAELAATFGCVVHVWHLANETISLATPELAATLIVDGSHRVATAEEVTVWQEAQLIEGERIESTNRELSRINRRSKEVDSNGRRFSL
jgi:hypothetical protein